MTFPLDYHSKNDLRPLMMFIVETGNRNPHVKKHDLRQSAKIKDDLQMHNRKMIYPVQ